MSQNDPSSPGSVDAIYAQVRQSMAAEAPAPAPGPVAPEVRVFPVRTPTLPPAAHTGCYVVGAAAGPQLVIDPASPYPDEQAGLDAWLDAAELVGPEVIFIDGFESGDTSAWSACEGCVP